MKKLFMLVVFLTLFCISVPVLALDVPTLTATTSGINVSLSWTSVPGATGYTLFYAPYPDASSIGQIDMGTQTSLSFDANGLAFYVATKAYNSGGSSDYSNIEYFELVGSSQSNAPYLKQTSNIGINLSDHVATHLHSGSSSWDDYVFTANILSKDDDTISLIFRYQDENNFYSFNMSNQTGYNGTPQVWLSKTVKGVNQQIKNLYWQYEEDLWYSIKIILDGPNIVVYRNNTLIFDIEDSTFLIGKIGLGCAWNEGAYFDDIEVISLGGQVLLSENFNDGDMAGWIIYDEPSNTDEGPSSWSVGN